MSELVINSTKTYTNQDNSDSRITVHVGGSRSGKSWAILQWLIVQALTDKKIVTIVRKTIPSLKRTVLKDYRDIMNSLGIWSEDEFNVTDRIYTFYNDSEIQFISTDDPQKLRGLKSDLLWLEEANEIDIASFEQLSMRTTGQIILSLNPSISPFHWIRQLKDAAFHHTTYKDNPFIEDTIKRALEDLKHTNKQAYEIYTLGNWTTNERAIFQFEQVEWVDEEAELVAVGVDPGYSQDPTAIVTVLKNGNNIYLIENCYEKQMTTKEIADKLKEVTSNTRVEVFCDSAEPRLIDEIYKEGVNIKAVKKGPDSINFGIQVMKGYKLHIPKSCQNLVNEFYSYQWSVDKFQQVTDRPEGGFDHLIDATRYVFMMKLSNVATAKGKYVISIR
jgi:phage terminase large subunit